MKYKDILVDTLPNCEYWGFDEKLKYDFGMIEDFHYEIYENKTILQYGDCPVLGYFTFNPDELILLGVAQNTPDNFTSVGKFQFKKEYNNPSTMEELKFFINDFKNCRISYLIELAKTHKNKFKS